MSYFILFIYLFISLLFLAIQCVYFMYVSMYVLQDLCYMHHLVQNQPNLATVNQAQSLKTISIWAQDPCPATWASVLKKEPTQKV